MKTTHKLTFDRPAYRSMLDVYNVMNRHYVLQTFADLMGMTLVTFRHKCRTIQFFTDAETELFCSSIALLQGELEEIKTFVQGLPRRVDCLR